MVHVVYVQLMNVDSLGNIVNKNSSTINQIKNTQLEARVIADPLIPSSISNPTVKDYLIAEDLLGFVLNHIDQTMIVTYG